MTQEEFHKLAESQCRSLHGDDSFNSTTSWKDGYRFAIKKVYAIVDRFYYGHGDVDMFIDDINKFTDDSELNIV